MLTWQRHNGYCESPIGPLTESVSRTPTISEKYELMAPFLLCQNVSIHARESWALRSPQTARPAKPGHQAAIKCNAGVINERYQ